MKGLIRRVCIVLLAVIGLALSPLSQAAYAQEPEIVDGIAAIVNGDVITYSQVRFLSMPREKVLRAQYHGDELVNKIKEIRKELRELSRAMEGLAHELRRSTEGERYCDE